MRYTRRILKVMVTKKQKILPNIKKYMNNQSRNQFKNPTTIFKKIIIN